MGAILTLLEVEIFLREVRVGRWRSAIQSHAFSLTTYLLFFASWVLRSAQGSGSQAEVTVSAFAVLLLWTRGMYFLQLLRGVGPFFIMVSHERYRATWKGAPSPCSPRTPALTP